MKSQTRSPCFQEKTMSVITGSILLCAAGSNQAGSQEMIYKDHKGGDTAVYMYRTIYIYTHTYSHYIHTCKHIHTYNTYYYRWYHIIYAY